MRPLFKLHHQTTHQLPETSLSSHSCLTRVVGERLGGSVLAGGDQVPDEALDVLVSTVVQQAVGQQRSADGLHVGLLQGPLEAAMGQDVAPPPPAGRKDTDSVGVTSSLQSFDN